MPADPNIFAPYVQPQVSPLQIQAELAKNDLIQSTLAQNQLAVQKQNALFGQQNALRQAVQSGQINLLNPDHQAQALAIAPDVAPGIIKTVQDGVQSAAKAKLDTAQAGEFDQKSTTAALTTARSMLPMVQTPQQYGQWVDGMFANPITAKVATSMGTPDQLKAQVQGMAPADFQQFLQKNAMGMDAYIQDQTKKRGQDITSQTELATNAASNKTRLQAAGIEAATSRANNAANIAKDYAVAGLLPPGQAGGTTNGSGLSPALEAEAQMIAAGKAPPPTGFAATRPMAASLMQRVSQINPNYDATDYAAKLKASKDFTTGTQGNALRSFAVAGQHLDQLGTLVDALNNGNMQIVNKVGNVIAEQTGSTAPTNFDAAKDIVSKEVVKAIVAGGGGQAERQELSNLMDKAKSPAQLKGVITQYRNLMGAQHDALLQQRRAAGLPDSTLPSYGPTNTASVPADIQAILDKHGTK